MKNTILTFALLTILLTACNEKKAAETTKEDTAVTAEMTDLTALKAEIQAIENKWAAADNARDANALVAYYAEDAITLANNKPAISGKAAILKDLQESLPKRPKGDTISFETQEVFGNNNLLTEVGKTTIKNAAGKVTQTGKYLALWEKRDGKWLTIRDMNNYDMKEK